MNHQRGTMKQDNKDSSILVPWKCWRESREGSMKYVDVQRQFLSLEENIMSTNFSSSLSDTSLHFPSILY